ncbi:MAG TPA: NrsF family protein [Vicinamibacterales bacterium]|nr:NrsF family protein [Vicinamibacterales bacterium]
MRTEDLIAKLAADGVAVQRLEPPAVLSVRWLTAAVLAVAAGVALFGARPDAVESFTRAGYVVLWLATLSTAAIASACAWMSAVPGAGADRRWTTLLWLAAGAWAALLVARLLAGGSIGAQIVREPAHAGCIAQIVALAALPALLLYRRLRRAAPLAASRTAMLASLAALSLAAAGSQVVCPIDSAAHQLPIHFVPTIAIAVLSVAAVRPLVDRLSR